MPAPEPVTPPAKDFGRRAQSIYDLEVTLVKFLNNIFSVYRFDNPTVNLAQASEPAHPIVLPPQDPDQPPVSYDYTARAQTLALKVPPQIVRGGVDRTVTGEIAVDKLPDYPFISVQFMKSRIALVESHTERTVSVQFFVHAYDENPGVNGDQDVANMLEAMEIALVSFGQQGIDQAYPIVLPTEWELNKRDTFPHFWGEMLAMFMLQGPRPMPDFIQWLETPGENIEMTNQFDPRLLQIAP